MLIVSLNALPEVSNVEIFSTTCEILFEAPAVVAESANVKR